ncbi:MAG: DUF1876 domain-containing protein [Gammaproteobacteria bacterium]|nr:DUF1876 domain-containing protein [Gammaproteobacteria bacterium]
MIVPTGAPFAGYIPIYKEKMLQLARRRGYSAHMLDDAWIFFGRQGNFTICIISKNGEMYVGVSKRNPTDVDNPEIGNWKAFGEALRRRIV